MKNIVIAAVLAAFSACSASAPVTAEINWENVRVSQRAVSAEVVLVIGQVTQDTAGNWNMDIVEEVIAGLWAMNECEDRADQINRGFHGAVKWVDAHCDMKT